MGAVVDLRGAQIEQLDMRWLADALCEVSIDAAKGLDACGCGLRVIGRVPSQGRRRV